MTLKSKLLLTNALFILVYAHGVLADTCGVLHYLASKSNGVTVSGNACQSTDKIALGAEFNLMPGARLWFKTLAGSDADKIQGICQSRSTNPLSISVDSSQQPWIKPNNVIGCTAWDSNKMQCADHKGTAGALTCVLAAAVPEAHTKGPEERTTSVRMRSLLLDDVAKSNGSALDSDKQDQIISALQTEADLCRAITPGAGTVDITWMVDKHGKVAQIKTYANSNVSSVQISNQQLTECITAVIKDFIYPKSSGAIWLSNRF